MPFGLGEFCGMEAECFFHFKSVTRFYEKLQVL